MASTIRITRKNEDKQSETGERDRETFRTTTTENKRGEDK